MLRVRTPLHPFMASHYACSRFFMHLDLMHLGDCSGFTSIIIGSVLCRAMDKLSLGENRDERMRRFNEFREEWYARHEPTNRLPEIRLTDLRNNKWAELADNTLRRPPRAARFPWSATSRAKSSRYLLLRTRTQLELWTTWIFIIISCIVIQLPCPTMSSRPSRLSPSTSA